MIRTYLTSHMFLDYIILWNERPFKIEVYPGIFNEFTPKTAITILGKSVCF